MDSSEPELGFHDIVGIGEFEKQLLYHATVSVLNINIHNSQVIHFSNFLEKNINNIAVSN